MPSWKPEVITRNSSVWAGNSLRFATKEEAEANVADLAQRWTLVAGTRVVPSDDPPTHHWAGGILERITDREADYGA
jgi:hypothetical protein